MMSPKKPNAGVRARKEPGRDVRRRSSPRPPLRRESSGGLVDFPTAQAVSDLFDTGDDLLERDAAWDRSVRLDGSEDETTAL
jgi:hypothetical protein